MANNTETASHRSQASIDLIISYGVALLIISITLYVILQLGIFNMRLAPTYCNTAPGFVCVASSISSNGVMTLVFTQATGVTLNIYGAACSTTANTITFGPKYGNYGVLPYTTAPAFYPSNQLKYGLQMYSSNQTRLYIDCYGGSGPAKGTLGTVFTGYVWLNYTVSSLPSNYHPVQQVVSLSQKYT